MKDALERIWYRAAPPPWPLRPLAALYGGIADARARRQRAAARHLPVPVIVVGNVAVGGTGKTPCVLWLVQALREMGHRPGVISRGYGGRGPFPHHVKPDDDPTRCGDEPLLLARRASTPTPLPIVVAPERLAAGEALLAARPEIDVIVCDDGLQHYRLARDLEFCVVDGARGYGNGWRLPAGPLREPPARAARARCILVNGADAAPYGASALRFDLQLQAAVNLASGERRPLAAFAGMPLRAVAGIGRPQRFFDALRAQGLRVRGRGYADHHVYRSEDLAVDDGSPLLMTEKDAVKCFALAAPHLWAVPATLRFAPPADARMRHYLTECLARTPLSSAG